MDIVERLRSLKSDEYIENLVGKSADEIERLRQQNAELLEALQPFAELAEYYDPPEGDDDDVAWDNKTRPTIGQLRTARAAITKATGGE